jgi:hypothetical protein
MEWAEISDKDGHNVWYEFPKFSSGLFLSLLAARDNAGFTTTEGWVVTNNSES